MDDDPCDFLAIDYNVPFNDLVQWNPSLDKSKFNCTLSPEYSYCVKKYQNSTGRYYLRPREPSLIIL